MMLVLGPIIFGFILGLVIGVSLKPTTFKFTAASYAVILIAVVLVAWQLGQFAFYNDLPIATGFIAGAVGLIIGKLLLGRGS